MFISNPNKRKSFGNQNGSPQSAKKFNPENTPNKKLKPGGTPQKTPNEQKSANKPAFSGKKQPQFSPANIKKDLVTPSPKLAKFSGTSKLNLSTNAVKQELGSAKKPMRKPNQAGAVGAETDPNRHTRRRNARKHKRVEAREKLKQLTIKVLEGDSAARHEIQEKVTELEKQANRSKTANKKLRSLQDLLSGKKTLRPEGNKKNQGAVQNQQKKGAAKNQANQKNQAVAQNQQKPANKQNQLTKASVKLQKQQGGKQNQLGQKGKKQTQELAKDSDESEEDEEEEDESDDEEDVASGEEASSGEDEEASDEEDSDEEQPANLKIKSKGVKKEEESSDLDEEGSDEDSDDEGEGSEEEESSDEQASPNAKQQNKPKQQKPIKKDQNADVQKAGKVSRYVVFVGNLPYTATREELTEHFKKVGEIVDVRIPTDKTTKKPKGFAYVEIKNEDSYQKALSLHNTFLGGRRINVLYTQGGKKKSEDRKGEIKAKNLKLQAMRNQGMLSGSVKADQKRSVRRAKKQQFEKKGKTA